MSSRWKRLKGALSHAGLLLALTVYTIVGGVVFRALEGPAESRRLHQLQEGVLEARRHLQLAVENASRARDPGLAELLHRGLHDYEAVLHEASRGGVEVPLLTASPPSATPPRWTLLQGVFFASTVLTTIGYGNIAPVTLWGRVFCLMFALIGIPLTLSVIADLGVLLASVVSALPCWGRCRSWWALDGTVSSGSGVCRNLVLALCAVLLLLVYLAAGAAMFTLWEEGWDFFDGFYFCFITMTTIGFGDLVPRQPSYTLLCTLYILVGLALTSTIIELVRMQYATSWRRLQLALAESGPALGEALRRLGAGGPDVHLKGLLAAVSLARLVPQGNKPDGKVLPLLPPSAVESQTKEWEQALAAVLKEMEDKKKEKERELERRRRQKRKEAKVIEIIIYETTV